MSKTIEENIEEINRKMNFIIGISTDKNPFELTAEQLQKAIDELKEKNDKAELELKEIQEQSNKIEDEFEQMATNSAYEKLLAVVMYGSEEETFEEDEILAMESFKEEIIETAKKDESIDHLEFRDKMNEAIMEGKIDAKQ